MAFGRVGQAALSVQLAEVVKDLAELKADTRAWQQGHEKQHADAEQARVNGRRWLISVGIAGVAAVAGLYPLVFFLVTRG